MQFTITTNISDAINYLNNVPLSIENDVWKKYPKLRTSTKKTVKSSLTKGRGINKGVYYRNIVAKNFATDRSEISFIVGGKKPHYRLTHLLENGHRVKVHGQFVKHIKSTGGSTTRSIPHIKPGQDYADEMVLDMYNEAILNAFTKFRKGMNKK